MFLVCRSPVRCILIENMGPYISFHKVNSHAKNQRKQPFTTKPRPMASQDRNTSSRSSLGRQKRESVRTASHAEAGPCRQTVQREKQRKACLQHTSGYSKGATEKYQSQLKRGQVTAKVGWKSCLVVRLQQMSIN